MARGTCALSRVRLARGGELDRDRQLEDVTTPVAGGEAIERCSDASPHVLRLRGDQRGHPHGGGEHPVPQLVRAAEAVHERDGGTGGTRQILLPEDRGGSPGLGYPEEVSA